MFTKVHELIFKELPYGTNFVDNTGLITESHYIGWLKFGSVYMHSLPRARRFILHRVWGQQVFETWANIKISIYIESGHADIRKFAI